MQHYFWDHEKFVKRCKYDIRKIINSENTINNNTKNQPHQGRSNSGDHGIWPSVVLQVSPQFDTGSGLSDWHSDHPTNPLYLNQFELLTGKFHVGL